MDCSTVSPQLSGELAEAFPDRFLALPVLGSPLVAGLQNRFQAVLTGSQDGWWATVLGAKDVGLAIGIAQRADVDLPGATVVRQLYQKVVASGLDQADIASVTKLYTGQ